jgi:hypothetical protein
MRTVNSIDRSKTAKDRLSLRLVMTFAVAFLATLALALVSGLFTALVERQTVAAEADVQAPVIVIDPKIQTDLAKAMAFDAIPAAAEVQNPFIDKAGIGGNALLTTMSSPTQASATASGPAANSPARTASGGGNAPVRSTTTVSGTATALGPEVDSSAATKMRFDDRMERVWRGEFTGPESEVFSVDDLLPVGYAAGGDRGDEVIFFSLSLCRTFSYPVGTRFFDGWLNAFNQNEVVFTVQNGLRRKSYSGSGACRGGAGAPTGAQLQ